MIRSAFLGRIKEAFDRNRRLPDWLLDPIFKQNVERSQDAYPKVLATAVVNGIWIPVMSTALHYYDGFRNARLTANLLQAQRDYFAAHRYERIDAPRDSFIRTNRTGLSGKTASSACTVQ